MSSKQQRSAPEKTATEEETPARRLAGQAVRGAAAGVARSVADWIIAQLTERAD